MRFLLTGAAGFLGSRLLKRLLCDGHEVQVLVRSRGTQTARERMQSCDVEVIDGDILNPKDWADHVSPVDVIIHCASSITFSEKEREHTMQTNVQGTLNLLEVAHNVGARFWYVSTAYVCGDNHDSAFETFEWCNPFRNPYEESKRLAEQAVANAFLSGRIPGAVIFRPSIIAGETLTGIAEAASGYLGYMYGAYQLRRIVEAKYQDKFVRDDHGRWMVPARIPCNPIATINIIPVDIVVNLMVELGMRCEDHRLGVFHLSHPNPPLYSALFSRSAEELGITGMEFVSSLNDAHREGIPRAIQVLEKLYGAAIADYIPYVSGEPRFDQTNVRSVLPDFESTIPNITDTYIALQMQWAMKHVYGKER
ncbi:MAG TPA: SDR family oxidoreductase [Patescibacteria group bacterium]|nr:SDR family oxidoreductase [Patescibacteria group bacterium]